MKAQYGILRFKKYKGPAISPIEAHNERTKEQYASTVSYTHLDVYKRQAESHAGPAWRQSKQKPCRNSGKLSGCLLYTSCV